MDHLPIYEPGLAEVVAEARGRNLFFSKDIDRAIAKAEMIFISVNTPTKTYGRGKGMAPDLKFVESCARQIAAVATSDKIVQTLYGTVSGKKISILGWAFKKDTNDTRESAAIYVADSLLSEEAEISVYDPKVSAEKIYADLDALGTRSPEENRRLVRVERDPYEAMDGSFAVAILTEWDEFKTYDWARIQANMHKPAFLFDGRRLLDKISMKSLGFHCFNLGQ